MVNLQEKFDDKHTEVEYDDDGNLVQFKQYCYAKDFRRKQ